MNKEQFVGKIKSLETISTIKVGDIICTNYGTGPYEVIDVKGPFTTPSFLDQLNLREKAPMSPPHFSYTCKRVGSKKREKYYLNGYDGGTHKNVWCDDRIITQAEELLPMLTLL